MTSVNHWTQALVGLICFVSIAQAALSSCSNYPCKNGARCINQPNTFYGYNCICNPPWSGVNCDQNKNQIGGNNINDNRNPGSNQYGYNNNRYGSNQYGSNNPDMFDTRYGGNQFGSNQFGNPDQNRYGNDYNQQFDNRYGQNQYQNNNPYYQSTQGACQMRPCKNGAYCQAGITPNHYKCLCRAGYYGTNCESYRTSKGALLGIILGTILPFFAIIVLISITLYCCCYKSSN